MTYFLDDLKSRGFPLGWEKVFEEAMEELEGIDQLLLRTSASKTIVPDRENIFNAFYLTPLDKVKVVIIGQDPYPQISPQTGKPVAQGFSFSVDKTDKIPSSLNNIFKELDKSIPEFKFPYHGDLSSWAKQGVLLLNSSLTCNLNEPNSHQKFKIWMPFISKILNAIPKGIYPLWGREAQKMKSYINSGSLILETSHPSGLSCHQGFMGCGHFVKINKELIKRGQEPIDWNV